MYKPLLSDDSNTLSPTTPLADSMSRIYCNLSSNTLEGCKNDTSTARPGDFICSSYKEQLRLVLRNQRGVHENFGKEIMSELGKYAAASRPNTVDLNGLD